MILQFGKPIVPWLRNQNSNNNRSRYRNWTYAI